MTTTRQEPVRDNRTVRRDPPRERYRPPPPDRPHRPSWDSRGWVLLGEQSVRGQNDRDTIRVGRRDGVFSRLMLVVEDSDLRVDKLIITYDNGRKHSPSVQHEFREGSRTRPIDLRGGDARGIKEVELRYGNVPGGGRATVQLWGKADEVSGRPEPPPPPRPGPDWDSRGWTLMAEQWVRGGKGKDFIRVGARKGTFTRLMVVVDQGELNLDDIIIEYDNGRKHSPQLHHSFRDGSRTRPVDLQGDARAIRRVELRYSNMGREERAKVQIWGRGG